MSWTAVALTLFPDMFPGPLGLSLAGKALAQGVWRIEAHDLRGFAIDRHGHVDDAPFGGGAGLVLRPDVVDAAIAAHHRPDRRLLYMSPRGRRLDQALVRDLAAGSGVTIVCGRYEGLDERVIEARDMMEVSIGDFVLSGGEPAALCLIDACVRLLPGVLVKSEATENESFEHHLLEHPHYTRPAVWQDRPVPEVLISGHHDKVRRWRRAQAEALTRERRPDLWQRHVETRAN